MNKSSTVIENRVQNFLIHLIPASDSSQIIQNFHANDDLADLHKRKSSQFFVI